MKHSLLATVLLLAGSPSAFADVIDSAPAGFTVKVVVDVAAPSQRAYQALTERIGSWWDKDHTWSGNAANLSIDARPGGCFCERLANGGVSHMTVIYEPGRLLRMSGGLGLFRICGRRAMVWAFLRPAGRRR